MAPRRLASSITLSGATKTNSASLSTKCLSSHGHATRSTLTRSRVIHFIASSIRPWPRHDPRPLDHDTRRDILDPKLLDGFVGGERHSQLQREWRPGETLPKLEIGCIFAKAREHNT